MKKTPEEAVYYIGDHVTQKGYPYLIAALNQCLKLDKFPRGELIILVYQPVADQFDVPLSQVTKAIGRATKDIWDKHSHKELDEIVGRHLEKDEKPAPKELIFYLYRYLTAK